KAPPRGPVAFHAGCACAVSADRLGVPPEYFQDVASEELKIPSRRIGTGGCQSQSPVVSRKGLLVAAGTGIEPADREPARRVCGIELGRFSRLGESALVVTGFLQAVDECRAKVHVAREVGDCKRKDTGRFLEGPDARCEVREGETCVWVSRLARQHVAGAFFRSREAGVVEGIPDFERGLRERIHCLRAGIGGFGFVESIFLELESREVGPSLVKAGIQLDGSCKSPGCRGSFAR